MSLLEKKEKVIPKLENVLSESVWEGEEVDVTAEKIWNKFIKPLYLIILLEEESNG